MKKYFLPFFVLFLAGCSFFEPTYFMTPKKISQFASDTKKKKSIDNIKWIIPSKEASLEKKNEYKGFIIYKRYDPSLKLWEYTFEPVNKGENVEFYYDKKLGYDGDLIKISLERKNGVKFLKDVVLIVENYQESRYIRTISSDEIRKKRKLKKRTLDRVNWKIGLPKEEKIDIK